VKVELHGLEIFGRHGVYPNEKRDGQMFLYDLEIEVAEPAEDDVAQAVDYGLLADAAQRVSDSRSFDLIESLAIAVADEIVAELPVEHARVTVRKPHPGAIPAQWAAATVERSR
jgi:dihydroneopterin aldolase